MPVLAPFLTRSDPGLNVVLAGTTSVRMTLAAASWSDDATPAVPLSTTIRYRSTSPACTKPPLRSVTSFVIRRLPGFRNVLISVAELLLGSGSGRPAGFVTVTVFVRLPNEPALTGAVTVNVAVPPLSRLTGVLISPLPEAEPVDPALYTAVHVAPSIWLGNVSTTVAPVTLLGPLLVTTIV